MDNENLEPLKGTGLRDRLATFQHNLIDRAWGVTVLLALVGLTNNVVAWVRTGAESSFAVTITVSLVVITGYFFREKIPFGVKVVFFILLQIALGFANFLDGGMFGAGWFWFVSASFLTAVFYSIRAGMIGLILFALLVAYVGVGYVSGSMVSSYDLLIRSRDVGTWVNFFTVVILVSLVILYMIGGYLKEIQDLLGEVSEQRNQAEAASRAKSEFLSNMSRELCAPLNTMLGVAQLIEKDPATAAKQKDQAHEIQHTGKLLLGQINDLLDLPRIEAGKIAFDMQNMTVGVLTARSFNLLAEASQKAGVTLVNDGGDGENAVIRADPIRLLQVVLNLLSNAIKYNVRSGDGRAHLSYERRRGSVRIVVRDTGLGIPEDKFLRVFNAFDRLGFEVSTIEGSGIGLMISKRIVEAMGGTICFDSVVGKGSTFWVEFDTADEVIGR